MPEFSKASLDKLSTCDTRLQALCSEAIKTYDFTVICGHRDKVAQDAAVASGNSHTPWPTSRHNSTPSQAVDLAPYPIDWDDIDRFRELARHILATANGLGLQIQWGGNFTTLKDYDHFQLG